MNMKGFASLLKQKRTTLNLSQGKVAELCYLSKSSYSHFEHGIRLPSLETLIRLSTVLKTDPYEFIVAILHDSNSDANTLSSDLLQEESTYNSRYKSSFVDTFNLLNQHEQKIIVDIIDSILSANEDIIK